MDEEFSRWSELPSCLLHEISDRLIFYDDYVRFSAVCVPWRIVYDDDQKKKKSSASSSSALPFLMVGAHYHKLAELEEDDKELFNRKWGTNRPSDEQHKNLRRIVKELWRNRRLIPQIRNLYNVVNKKVCDFEVKLSHNYYCRGSSFGWLITLKPKWKFGKLRKYYVQLYNPFLSHKHNIIYLPPLHKILKHDTAITMAPFFYVYKAVLSCNPLFNKDYFVVMAIATAFAKLAFYTPENKDWFPINWEMDYSVKDVIYFNKTQQFYALLDDGAVSSIDLIRTKAIAQGGPLIVPKLTQVAPPIDDAFEVYGRRYLVETMSGELLHVYKRHGPNPNPNPNPKFEVLKLDPVTAEWSQIHDIGDTILFLGDNSSISRSASEFPGCKPNCIYFTDDTSPQLRYRRIYKPLAMGIYNLADGTHQPHYPIASSRNDFPAPIWLDPTLQRCNHLRYLE